MNRFCIFTIVLSTFVWGNTAGLPFEFKYDGKVYRGTEGRIDDNLTVRVERASNPEFRESEYTVWFENNGNQPSKILEDVYALKTEFSGNKPVLRGCLGDHENWYKAYEYDLTEKPVDFESTLGRATHIYFPYFDLVHGKGGTRIALGWGGTWNAHFEAKGSKTFITAQTNLGLHTVLLPGEKIRTGLVVFMDYDGRDEYQSVNQWREWFIKYNQPKADAAGNPIRPFSTSCLSCDTGLPNSDGSISERYFTWQSTLAVMRHEGLLPDFRWFDAGWYSDPAGNSVSKLWWNTVGSWEVDHNKWPGNTLRESMEACHALGMKTLAWFEPERVSDVENLSRNYGYKPEWGVKVDEYTITNNLGKPECLQWTVNRITKMMEENAIDLYREDNNSDQAPAWETLDQREEIRCNLPRKGISENKFIQGHYAMWDAILAFCRKHGKCGFMDSCASGGGRNDIESMRRALPFLRSDADRTTLDLRLSMTSSLCKWIPFNGANVGAEECHGDPDAYQTRASLLPIWSMVSSYSHNPNIDFDKYRAALNTWKKYKDLLVQDFYHLTPYHGIKDKTGWTVFAYNDRKKDEGIVLAFRQPKCDQPTCTIKLPFVQKGKVYSITNTDTNETIDIAGTKLLAGYTLSLAEPRSSLLLEVKQKND